MRKLNLSKADIENLIWSMGEGAMLGALLGVLLGAFISAGLWCLLWNSMIRAAAMPDVLYGAMMGLAEGALVGAALGCVDSVRKNISRASL